MQLEHLPKKPNIVLIITDQEREVMHWPDGWAEANLPARSRLMAHGLRFSNAYCNSGTCSPSRATLLTGRHLPAHGVVDNGIPLDARELTLPAALGAQGYATYAAGKLHLTPYQRAAGPEPGEGLDAWFAWLEPRLGPKE